MNPTIRPFLAASLALLLCVIPARAEPASPRGIAVPNPGFEEALTHWDVRERLSPMSTAVAEAARTGALGLRIVDDDPVRGSSASTQAFPVTPGLLYRVTLWARAEQAIAGAYIHFHRLDDNQRMPGVVVEIIPASSGEWRQLVVEGRAPPEAGTALLELHSFNKNTGVVDVDDIIIQELAGSGGSAHSPVPAATAGKPVAALEPVVAPGALSAPVASGTTPAKAGLYIVVKLDDVNTSPSGWLSEKWRRVGTLAAARKMKFSLGVITRSLESPKADYVEWLQAMRHSGWVEFWFHAYDHTNHTGPDGVPRSELTDRDPVELKRRFDLSQELAVRHLGAPFTVFGPPGGGNTPHVNADTLRVVHEDPYLRVILYPSPIDDLGRELQARGKVAVLDRVWQINIEQPLFVPNYEKFAAGYRQHSAGRQYLVIQGHPARWDDARFAEFERILDFLKAEGAVFVTAAELAGRLRANPAGLTPGAAKDS